MPRILKQRSADQPELTGAACGGAPTVQPELTESSIQSAAAFPQIESIDLGAAGDDSALAPPQAVYAQRLRRVVEQAERQLHELRDVWRQRWEQEAVRLACRIAGRCLRELPFDSAQLARTLVNESLRGVQLDASCEVRLHPDDYQVLTQDQQISAHEIVLLPDSQIEPGGCVVRTPEGVIDQQLSSQLSRVEDELTRM